jgi:hypothetical protein
LLEPSYPTVRVVGVVVKFDNSGRTYLVWIVAAASSVEAAVEGTTSFLHELTLDAVIWWGAALLISGAAGFIEMVKTSRGD